MTIIMAVDPGGDNGTGYAVYDSAEQNVLLLHESPDSTLEFMNRAHGIVYSYDPDVLIVERFKPRWGNAFSLDPVKKIGAMEASGLDFVFVDPATHMSAVKNPYPNYLFKQYGQKIGKGHAREALRMCLWYSGFKLKEEATLKGITGFAS